MSKNKHIQLLLDEATSLLSKGQQTVQTSALIKALQNIPDTDSGISDSEMAKYKAEMVKWTENQRQKHEFDLEMFRSVISSGQAAARSVFLLSGGGAVAVLAFTGHLVSSKSSLVPGIADTLLSFCIAAILASVVAGATYLSQYLFASNNKYVSQAGHITNVLAILAGLGSLVVFSSGVYDAHSSLKEHAGPHSSPTIQDITSNLPATAKFKADNLSIEWKQQE